MKKITLIARISLALVLIMLLISGCQQFEGASSTLETQEAQSISTEAPAPTPTPKPTPEPTPSPGYTLHPDPTKDFRFCNWGDSFESVINSDIYPITKQNATKATCEGEIYGIPVTIGYHFATDQLWIGEYKFPKLTDVKESVKLYDVLKADLVERYGEPTTDASDETKILLGWMLDTVVVSLEYKDAVPTVRYVNATTSSENKESPETDEPPVVEEDEEKAKGGLTITVQLNTFNTEEGKDFRYFNWGDSFETVVQIESQSRVSEAVDMVDDAIMYESSYAVDGEMIPFNVLYSFEDDELVQIAYLSQETYEEDLQGHISTIDWFSLNYGKSIAAKKINGMTAFQWHTESAAIILAVSKDHKTVILIEPIDN